MLGSKRRLCVVDCSSGQRNGFEKGTFLIGSASGCSMVIDGGPEDENLVRLSRSLNSFQINPGPSCRSLVFDGTEVGTATISDEADHTVVANGFPFALRMAKSDDAANEWIGGVDPSRWYAYKRDLEEWVGPVSPHEVPHLADGAAGEVILMCGGLKTMGFFPEHVLHRLVSQDAVKEETAPPPPPPDPFASIEEPAFATPEVNAEYGEFTCPVCWFRFDRGDVMNIAVHAALQGDPVLGEEHMQRFLASRFNDRGQAVDAMGMAAPDQACPHCRRKLPPHFLDQPHHIFSIVGAPSSGKSYYLSVLVKLMQDTAFRDFGITFRDADPSANVALNQMRNSLFTASAPKEAFLAKTDLEGALYENLPRQGRMVKLPKPFIFRMSDREQDTDGFSIVFYDNAGEHFEPGRNSAESPGAQHVAVASGIFFLFDPLANPVFRKRLEGHEDPQLSNRAIDQQDILLSETETRIKAIRSLHHGERIPTPLAVIVGKSDSWLQMLGPEPLLPAVTDTPGGKRIRIDHLNANSQRIRDLMLETAPAIVANAEAISSDVLYFAASPLGHAPVKFLYEDQSGPVGMKIGPDPTQLDPRRVEDATLWVLSKISPTMFPFHS